jgi:hypothetical protein
VDDARNPLDTPNHALTRTPPMQVRTVSLRLPECCFVRPIAAIGLLPFGLVRGRERADRELVERIL